MKKLYGIVFILVCFSFALFNARASAIDRPDISVSINAPLSSLSNLPFTYPNSDIEISNIHCNSTFQGIHRFQKLVGFLSIGFENVIRVASFSSSDNSLPGYLHIKKYLSHIYPFHHFW